MARTRCGIENIAGVVTRGVLFDVPAFRVSMSWRWTIASLPPIWRRCRS